ncbi:MAG TPA: glycosyltransferase family 2 protein [Solirubrobacteraceae bacterium]
MAVVSTPAGAAGRPQVVGRLRGLSIVLPCHNEAENVERAIDEATAAGELVADAHEVLVVDDGSLDATRELAQARAGADPRVRVLIHEENRGYGAAVRAGLAAGRLEWLFLTDADLQFDLTELTRFVPLAPSSDIVAGYRIHRADPPHRVVNAAAWNLLVHRLFDVPLRDVDCAFKLMRRDVVQALSLTAEGAMVSTELVTRARAAGARIAQLGVTHRPRPAGRPSGASPRVVLRAFRELRAVRAELRRTTAVASPPALSRPRAA